jgi:hypothetical protein
MTYFVTVEWLKANTTINQNVDVADIVPLIKTSAQFKTKGYIGTHFFNDLLTKFNTQTLNAAEEILVQEYMKPAIAWRAASESVINTSYQVKNKGVQTQSGDYSAAADYKAIMWLVQHYTDKADYYDQKLVDFLKAHKDDYPEFMSKSNDDAQVSKYCDHTDTFTSQIIII